MRDLSLSAFHLSYGWPWQSVHGEQFCNKPSKMLTSLDRKGVGTQKILFHTMKK